MKDWENTLFFVVNYNHFRRLSLVGTIRSVFGERQVVEIDSIFLENAAHVKERLKAVECTIAYRYEVVEEALANPEMVDGGAWHAQLNAVIVCVDYHRVDWYANRLHVTADAVFVDHRWGLDYSVWGVVTCLVELLD